MAGSIVSVGEALSEGASLIGDIVVEMLGRRTPSRRKEATIWLGGSEGVKEILVVDGTVGPTLGSPAGTVTLGGGRMGLNYSVI